MGSVLATALNVNLARVQFASTSIYHFLFVPITIGLALLTALLQTFWHRRGTAEYRQLARFFGTLLLINVAIGVVTGLVQEFEFGMNWSAWSRYVGDVFGGPLAMEGLAAFFLESTFLGLWIFGWDRLPKRVHLACIWIVFAGTTLSALFIMTANSWMQHPVGYTIDKATNQAQLTDVWKLFTNPLFIWGYVHVLLASVVTGCMIMLAVSAWHMRRHSNTEAFRRTAGLATAILLPVIVVQLFVGDELGVIEGTYQPMKIAAAESLWNTCPSHCPFSMFQVGGGKAHENPNVIIQIPDLLSVLATNHLDGEVQGMNQLQAEYQKKYGPGSYIPNVFIQYWSMRLMAYLGVLVLLIALVSAWLLHRQHFESQRWFLWIAIWSAFLPFLLNTAGWLLTENGRQPWIVQGLMTVQRGVSPSVSASEIWITLILFLALYLALGIVDAFLMIRYARRSLTSPESADPEPATDEVAAGALIY